MWAVIFGENGILNLTSNNLHSVEKGWIKTEFPPGLLARRHQMRKRVVNNHFDKRMFCISSNNLTLGQKAGMRSPGYTVSTACLTVVTIPLWSLLVNILHLLLPEPQVSHQLGEVLRQSGCRTFHRILAFWLILFYLQWGVVVVRVADRVVPGDVEGDW